MNVTKLKRVAIKEFTRSPAKTGILLAMIPIALYFCAPSLFGTLKKASPSSSAATRHAVAKQADFVLPVSAPETTAETEVPGWVEVGGWLDHDLLAVPAGISSSARNPFAAIQQTENEESVAVADRDDLVLPPETEQGLQSFAEQSVVPRNPIRELGLQLNATIVGRRLRLATINGKTYEQGELIPVLIKTGLEAEAVATMQLQLAHVDRRFVVLEADGHQHRLQLRNELPKDAIVVKRHPE